MNKICIYCGKEYKTYSNRQKYCSVVCSVNSQKGVKKNIVHKWENAYNKCEYCGNMFAIHNKAESKHRFCSVRCANLWRGKYNKSSYKEMSLEQRIKNSNKLKEQWKNESFRHKNIDRMTNNNPSKQRDVVNKINNTKIVNNTIGFKNDQKCNRGGNGKISPIESLVYDFLENLNFKYNYSICMKELRALEPNRHFATNYKPDFTNLNKKICIELDGQTHNSNIGRERDSKKEYALNWYGYKVLRYSNDYVKNNLQAFKQDILKNLGYKVEKVKNVVISNDCSKVYDIEVEHNHNYFANNVLVHNCRNPQSQQGKGLMAFDSKADRIGMTGTLLVNNPYDLYTPMLFTGLISYNKWLFEQKFVIKDDWGKPMGYQNMEELHQILYRSSIRRTKDLLDLPPKIYKQEWLEFSSDEQNVFDAVTGNGNMQLLDKIEPPIDMFAKLTRMRQATTAGELLSSACTSSTKFERLKDILEEAKLNGQKVLVFCQFTEALKLGLRYCQEYAPKLVCGGMGAQVQEIINEHENTKGFSVIFAQEATLGAGFTLTNTEICVFLTPPWNKATYDQCADRIHRIGQKKTVQIIDLLIQDTYDELVYLKLHGKGAMSEALIDGKVTPEIQAMFKKMGIEFTQGTVPELNKLF